MRVARQYWIPAAMGTLLMFGSTAFAETRTSQGKQEEEIKMTQVPKPALDAAKKALHATPTDAKAVVATSPTEYDLTAKNASGKWMSVHVLADGTVLKQGKSHRQAKADQGTYQR